MSTNQIDFYSADWCGDCRRTKRLFDSLGVEYTLHDVEKDDAARERAIEISGVQSIPVVMFSDGTYMVEPSDPDMRDKLLALGIISA